MFGKVGCRQSRCWQRREKSLAYGDTESLESCIGLAHGQMTVKVGETSWLSSSYAKIVCQVTKKLICAVMVN
jgi:hypothetical protein